MSPSTIPCSYPCQCPSLELWLKRLSQSSIASAGHIPSASSFTIPNDRRGRLARYATSYDQSSAGFGTIPQVSRLLLVICLPRNSTTERRSPAHFGIILQLRLRLHSPTHIAHGDLAAIRICGSTLFSKSCYVTDAGGIILGGTRA